MDRKGVIGSIFGVPRALVGMIHLQALPGTPGYRLSMQTIVEQAAAEARAYLEAGFHGLLIENMHDRPYLKSGVGPEITAAMATVAAELRRTVTLPLGIQVLAGANREAIAVAMASGASFVRAEGFVFAHVADEGVIESDAAGLLRYRRTIGAEQVQIFVDLKKKHAAHALTADVDLVETALAAEFFLADGVVVTGPATGRAADPEDLQAVSDAVSVPTVVGSGITADNLHLFTAADTMIVGSSVKCDGLWSNPLDPARAEALVQAFEALPPLESPLGEQ